MNPHTDSNSNGRNLTTADLARAGARTRVTGERERLEEEARIEDETRVEDESAAIEKRPARVAEAPADKLDALFTPEAANEFRSQWTDIQARFVDDPRQAVRDGDELVARVMKSLAESFASERDRVESQLMEGGDASTELLRVALRRYRSFFERLLTL